jgi:hypothetical protein
MTEKDVLKKLNVLRDLKPSAEWKASSRELLFAQVSNSSENVKIGAIDSFIFEIKNALSFFAQPAFAALGLFVFLAGGAFTVNAAKNTKPGDSFYAARVWGQKARVAVTFDARAKAKMEMKYASVRAQEITAVLSDPSFDLEGNKEKAEQLAKNFKAEIQTVTDKYEEMNKLDEPKSQPIAAAQQIASSNVDDDNVAIGIGRPSADAKVFAADSSKASSGIQISQPAAVPASIPPFETPAATSSDTGLRKNLDEAVASFETHDFALTKDILNQVDDMISKIDQGEVKGVSEAATSVSEVIGAGTVSSSQEGK